MILLCHTMCDSDCVWCDRCLGDSGNTLMFTACIWTRCDGCWVVTTTSIILLGHTSVSYFPGVSCIPFSHEIGFCDRSAFSSNSPARMRLSVPIDTPLSIPRTRAVAIFLSAVLQTYALLLCLPFSLLRHLSHVSLNPDLVAFFFFFFFSTERVDERNIKAPTDTSKRRPTTSEDAWVFFMR